MDTVSYVVDSGGQQPRDLVLATVRGPGGTHYYIVLAFDAAGNLVPQNVQPVNAEDAKRWAETPDDDGIIVVTHQYSPDGERHEVTRTQVAAAVRAVMRTLAPA